MATSQRKKRALETRPLYLDSEAGYNSDYADRDNDNITISGINVIADRDEELAVEVEHLQSKLASLEDEYNRFQDKHNRQMSFMETEVADLKKALTVANDKYFEEKKKWQAKLRTLESSNTTNSVATTASNGNGNKDLMDKIGQLETKLHEKNVECRKLSLVNTELEGKLNHQQKLSSLLPSVPSTTSSSSSDAAAALSLLSTTAIASSIATGAPNDENNGELLRSASVSNELKKRISELEIILSRKQREITKLESKLQNSALQEQEIDSLKHKIGLLESKILEFEAIEQQMKGLQLEKQEWAAMLSTLSEASASHSSQALTPAMIVKSLSATQKKCAQLALSESSLQAKLATYKTTIEKLENQLEIAKTQLATAEESARSSSSSQRQLQQQCAQFEREVVNLRVMVKSYEAEVQLGSKRSVSSTESLMLQNKETALAELRTGLDESRRMNKELTEQLRNSQEAVEVLKKRLESGEGSAASSATASAASDSDLLDYDPKETKVLHLSFNPLNKFAGTKKATSVPTIVSSGSGTANSVANTTTNMSVLETGPDSSKLNQRLKEMFKERITTFREAVYLLTGYKVDLITADASTNHIPRLRLRSMYAEDPSDALLFQWRENTLELLDTPYVSKLDSSSFSYLSTCHSVPAFLSSVTLQMFENQTFQG